MNKQDFIAERYDPLNNRTIYYQNDSRLKTIVELLKKFHGKKIKVLDLGCYNGEIGALIKDSLGADCIVYGIDAAENAVPEAEKRGLIAKRGNLDEQFDFSDSFFDIVFAGEIIEHIYDTDYFVSEIKRVLKPGGTLLVTTPNFLSLGRRLSYFFGIGVFMEASLCYPDNPPAAGHIRFFTKKLLVDYLKRSEFTLIRYTSDTINFPGFSVDSLAKTFPTLGIVLLGYSIMKNNEV